MQDTNTIARNWRDLIRPKKLEAETESLTDSYGKFTCEPLERGYDGPIKILVGLDSKGILTGIVVAEHNEPYGNFSVDLPRFPAQFRGKNIRDPFRVGGPGGPDHPGGRRPVRGTPYRPPR